MPLGDIWDTQAVGILATDRAGWAEVPGQWESDAVVAIEHQFPEPWATISVVWPRNQ